MATLYVVATPIGNLSDASPRMLETLERASLIAAEDTRVTGNLLRHFGLQKPMTSLHRHNEADKAGGIVARMVAEDIDVALVTDAGTPAISDPGYLLVRAAAEAGFPVLAVAGPSAMAAALSVSGFDTREFAFYGFLPREKADLKKKLLSIARGPKIAVLHESPHRIIALMETVTEALPGCNACVCCDLTKLYEKTIRGGAGEVANALKANPKADKGEYCVVLDIGDVMLLEEKAAPACSLEALLVDGMLSGATPQEAMDAATEAGARKNEIKRAMLRIRKWMEDGFPAQT